MNPSQETQETQEAQEAPSPQPAVEQPPVAAAPAATDVNQAANVAEGENPDRNYLIALLLSYLFGPLGIDRFYLGKTGTAIAKLLTGGGLGIWAVVDTFLIAYGKLKAKGDDRPLEGYTKNSSWVRPIATILLIITAIIILLYVVLGIVAFTRKTLP